MRGAAAVLGALVWINPSGGALARLNGRRGTVSSPSNDVLNYAPLFMHDAQPNNINSNHISACRGAFATW